MSVKIVHCGDVHLGASGGEKRNFARRRAEIKQTFLRIVDFASENSADLLLIAGDLFDSHKISADILAEISAKFSEFGGTVFISPGNHDYYGADTFWEKANFPSNVKIFKSPSEVVELPQLGVKIFGSAFCGAFRYEHILSSFSASEDTINIAVIHGDMTPGSAHGPIDAAEIANSNMDYIALGHIHKRTEVSKAGGTYYAYCGCPEGQGFDETGAKGFYFGTVDKKSVNLEFIPVCMRQFIEETVDISSAEQKFDVPDIILRKIDEKYGAEGFNWYYKITLTGETALGINTAEVAAALSGKLYFAKVKNKTKTPVSNLKSIAEENTVRGIFVKKMLERYENDPSELNETALRTGLAAFSEEVGFNED